ncbi:hypothetical protein [Bordetella bronchialis]|uniref:Holin n=1 Tax=Bordetella bronchialis TaxID=463025 RepID=A0A193FUX7_9BORD|nr:hypothetical protein [Bordetella bronchialis]ANN71562.1 hypothetical protein BAU08_09615 [Bordetella bronchialis]
MKLVANWRQAWRWFSIHCMATATAIQGAYISLPDDMRRSIPLWAVVVLTMAILGLGVWGRLIDQDKKGKGDGQDQS